MNRWMGYAGRLSSIAGALCLCVAGGAYLDGAIASQLAIGMFTNAARTGDAAPDQTLWSERAKAAYVEALAHDLEPVGVLRVPRLAIEVPVFMGTAPLTLNRGVGVIQGTASPGTIGNIGISGHRDSYLRALKDIEVGDLIELASKDGAHAYRVTNLSIVDPLDVSPIEPSPTAMLTIVTCHPFYYVGPAPDRFIVRALPVEPAVASGQ